MSQSFVTHLESALDGTRFAPDRVHSIHQGRPLWVRYDLAAVRAAVTPADFAARPPSLWRYRELLPLPAGAEPVTLGEGLSPMLYGAKSYRVNGLITDCGKIVREGTERMGWFDLSTLKEPYRLEGKKTMGLEVAEQFGWQRLPDVILYPTGGGTGLIGMWKAF